MTNPDTTFQAGIGLARKLGKPLYFVRTLDGITADCVTTRASAFEFLKGRRCSHLYEIWEQSPLGHLKRIHKPPAIGFQLIDCVSKINAREGSRVGLLQLLKV